MDKSELITIIGTLFTVSVLLIGSLFGLVLSMINDMRKDVKRLLQDVAALKSITKTRRHDDLIS